MKVRYRTSTGGIVGMDIGRMMGGDAGQQGQRQQQDQQQQRQQQQHHGFGFPGPRRLPAIARFDGSAGPGQFLEEVDFREHDFQTRRDLHRWAFV